MGDKQVSGYINLGALHGALRPDAGGLTRPDPTRGPVFVSHELQLRRDLQIVNARIAAELGPLPLGGLPVQAKRRIDAKGRQLPQLSDVHANEEEAMNLNQIAAAAAMTAALVACEPQTDIAATGQTQTATPAAERAAPVASETQAAPKAATVPERVTADTVPVVPDEIRAFVPPDSTLLAYKRFDLTEDGNEDAVLIVRHPVTEKYPDFSKNPCDLIVLHGEESGLRIAAKSSKAVDCTYKLHAREIAKDPGDLNYLLKLKPKEITSYDETDKPTGVSTTYSFKYSDKEKDWYLSYARAAFARSKFNGEEGDELDEEKWELVVYTQEISYPKDMPFISLSKFDPDDDSLLRAMIRNQKEN